MPELLRYSVVTEGTPEHRAAFGLVQREFLAAFGARVTTPAFRYAVATGESCRPVAVLAVRQLDHDRSGLSERYLDEPIEAWLSRHVGVSVPRDQLVEAGSLACAQPACAEPMLRFAAMYSYLAGHAYILLTATRPVRLLLRRMRQPLTEICDADPGRLEPALTREWGAYYSAANRPRVCVIDSAEMFRTSALYWRQEAPRLTRFTLEQAHA